MRRITLTMGETAPAVGSVEITDQTITSTTIGTSAKYQLNTSGDAQYDAGAGSYSNISGEWMLSGASSDYECRMQVVSGTVSTGTTGPSWQALSSTRTWTVSTTVGNDKSFVGTLSIRDAATLTVLDSCTITLNHLLA